MKNGTYLWYHLTPFFSKSYMFQTKFVEKTKTHIVCSTIFNLKLCH